MKRVEERWINNQIDTIIQYCKKYKNTLSKEEIADKIHQEQKINYDFALERVDFYFYLKDTWEPFKEKILKEDF